MKLTKKWLKAAVVRAVKTFFQAAIAAIGTAQLIGDVNWIIVIETAGLAAILSIMTSLAGLPEIDGLEVEKNE